jgi:hypothetical protein
LAVFFSLHFSFTSLAIYFSVIAVYRGRHVESKEKRKGCFYICAPYWHNKCY